MSEGKEWLNISKIMKQSGFSQFAIYKAVGNLKEIELIVERKGNWNAREFGLTTKGKKVKLALKTVSELIDQ